MIHLTSAIKTQIRTQPQGQRRANAVEANKTAWRGEKENRDLKFGRRPLATCPLIFGKNTLNLQKHYVKTGKINIAHDTFSVAAK